MTQPVITSTWPVLRGSVSEPITCTWTCSRGSWYFAMTALMSGRAVAWIPIFLPTKSRGELMLLSSVMKANGCR